MGDRLPVNCGVKLSGNKFVLSYKVGKNVAEKDVMWDWCSEADNYIARLEAKAKNGDIKYHNSAPIDAEMFDKLGSVDSKDKTLDSDGFYKVSIKKKSSDVPDLTQFFDVPQ